MRTIIDLPEDQLDALDALCRRDGISRAEAVRRAVAILLRNRQAPARAGAFGLWAARGEDGVAYQRRVRSEWSSGAGRRPRR